MARAQRHGGDDVIVRHQARWTHDEARGDGAQMQHLHIDAGAEALVGLQLADHTAADRSAGVEQPVGPEHGGEAREAGLGAAGRDAGEIEIAHGDEGAAEIGGRAQKLVQRRRAAEDLADHGVGEAAEHGMRRTFGW